MEIVYELFGIALGIVLGNVVSWRIEARYFTKTLSLVSEDAEQVLRKLEADGMIPAATIDTYLAESATARKAVIDAALKSSPK